MFVSTLNSKGQVIIPLEVLQALHLNAGDKITFEVKNDQAIITKAEPLDASYYKNLALTLSEWTSIADEESYCDL